jgi:hypothetical protein
MPIKKVCPFAFRIILFFLADFANQTKNKIRIKTLIEARSTPLVGLSASWKGRYADKKSK